MFKKVFSIFSFFIERLYVTINVKISFFNLLMIIICYLEFPVLTSGGTIRNLHTPIEELAENSRLKNCLLPQHPIGGKYIVRIFQNYSTGRNGTLTIPGLEVAEGTILIYSCNTNRYLLGNPYVPCINGKFNNIPQCSARCPPVNSTELNVYCFNSCGKPIDCGVSNELLEGSTMKLECKQNYHLEKYNQKKTVSCKDGAWDASPLECKPACGVITEGEAFVVNGFQSHISKSPWQVAVYQKFQDDEEITYICSGSILSRKFILSAAHCFTDEDTGNFRQGYEDKTLEFFIAAGKSHRDYNDPRDANVAEKRSIVRINVPEDYKGEILRYSHDLAVLELDEELPVNSFMRPICLDYSKEKLNNNETGWVSSFGFTEPGFQKKSNLMQMSALFIEKKRCWDMVPKSYRQFLPADHVCAGRTNGTGICDGDSGSGLVFKRKIDNLYYIRGIVSNGPMKMTGIGECDPFSLAGYTDVQVHLEFIKRSLQAHN